MRGAIKRAASGGQKYFLLCIAVGTLRFSPPYRAAANPRSAPHLAATGRRYIDLAAMSHPAPLLPLQADDRVTSAILFASISRRL